MPRSKQSFRTGQTTRSLWSTALRTVRREHGAEARVPWRGCRSRNKYEHWLSPDPIANIRFQLYGSQSHRQLPKLEIATHLSSYERTEKRNHKYKCPISPPSSRL